MTSDIVMEGVREHGEWYDVSLQIVDDRLCVIALNESGNNCTSVDLEDLLEWLSKQENMDQARMLKILTKLRGE